MTAEEREGERKVSLRATGDDVDVSAIARAQGGGGHRRAAGLSTSLELDELIAFLRHEIAAQLHPAHDGTSRRRRRERGRRRRKLGEPGVRSTGSCRSTSRWG